ncbi:MAG: glycosyltransferase family 9 protein [Bacteroidales bacterium]|nr:glycosyltransferase family 9 protein [Bacteroidales bacterium]
MEKRKVLIIRFSALGDVAMTIPVVYSLAKQNPETEFVFLSKPALRKLFFNAPDNFTFEEIDFKNRHKGIAGLWRLFRELRKQDFDQIADLHSVLRSHILSFFFRFTGIQIASIDKQRKAKRELIAAKSEDKQQLPTSFERYEKVFRQLGFVVETQFTSIFATKGDTTKLGDVISEKKEKWIGIAPFAKHTGKIYPIEKMEKMVALLSKENVKIYLFGGGNKEKMILGKWEETYPNVISTVGRIDMEKELILMSHLDGMVTMDSGNMHLASLVSCPVVSVWGATHTLAGFYGWNQNPTDAVQIDLDCRPCSIYGNKECHRGDYACLNEISPQMLSLRIKQRFL